jgi:tetratricopeptide (TPR) repeat protein
MWSNILDRISFLALFCVIVLLPVFLLPFTKIPVETSKGLLVVVGLAISIIFWAVARFSDGKVNIPNSSTLLAGLAVVVVFFLSAFLSKASAVSFFGTMFDLGSFWFIFTCFLLMFASSVVLGNRKNAKMVLFGVIISTGVVLLFQALRFFVPQHLTLGILSATDKTDNLLGSWNAFGIFAGLSALVSLLVVEFFSVTKAAKWIFSLIMVVSLLMVASVNSSFVWEMVGIFSLIIFVYKISFSATPQESEAGGERKQKAFPGFSFTVVMVALLFFMSGQFIGGLIPNHFGLSNTEIYPSFGATMSVTKEALKHNPILGVGPNRFSEAWALYKPAAINGTDFWDVPFSFGSGVLPTFAATTGILGILAWLVFFFTLIAAAVKYVFRNSENSAHKEMTLFFVLAFYLFIASFFYLIGPALFMLAFAFVGVFIGLIATNHRNSELSWMFLDDHRKSFFFILALVAVMVLSAATAFKFVERFASVAYFNETLTAAEIPQAETAVSKALSLYSNDLYLRAYSQVYLVKLNSIVSKGANLSDADKATLQSSFEQAVGGAQLAVNYNPRNYFNLQTLGGVYGAAGSLGVDGAYDKAIEAYKSAQVLNPLNPGIDLALAQVSFASNKHKDAKDYANAALKLKANYIDALILLSQIAKSEGNSSDALNYAEQALSISPANKDLVQYVNSLKSPSSSTTTTTDTTKK